LKATKWLLIGVLTAILVACGGANGEDQRTVVIGTTAMIDSLDPADSYTLPAWEVFINTNLGLMSFEPGTTDLVPGVAADYPDISEDRRTYTFYIEPGWTYPDGTELVAGDFVRSVNRALTLEGAVSGLVTTYVERVEAPDDQTVIFHLAAPRSDFPQIVTGVPYMPAPEGAYPDDALNQFPETVYGVGPWQIVEYDIEEQVVLERNPNYKPGFPERAPDRVILRHFQDSTTLALAVDADEVDIAWRTLGPGEIKQLSMADDLTTHSVGGGHIRYLVPTHTLEPFDDRNVRQALAYLVDREEIVDRVYQGTVEPLYSQVPPGFLGAGEAFLDLYGTASNLDAARELLSVSGYSENNPLVFELWYPLDEFGPQVAQICQVLKEQFEATGLIEVTLQGQEWSTYIGGIVAGEYPIGYLAWQFDYPDTSNYLEPFAASRFSVVGQYSNPEIDNLLDAASLSTDLGEREELYVQAQQLYAEDVVTLPLTLETEYAFSRNDKIDNLIIGPTLRFHYDLIELK
jgi:peptide/nickel transport system substrate-binding protein